MKLTSKVAVILPLYSGDTSKSFRLALRSILRQSVVVDVFIVIDGPLANDLYHVLNSFKDYITQIHLEKNVGLARALNYAIGEIDLAQYEFIARMDADDFSVSCRIFKQIEYMNKYSLDVCGSDFFIFDNSRNRQYVTMPKSVDKMRQNIILMSPMCHPSVMFRSSVLQKERYPINTYFQEDYRLWVKLLKKGYKLGNVPQPLLYFRFSDKTQKRRTNVKKLTADLRDRLHALEVFSGSKTYGYFQIFFKFTTIFLLGRVYKHLIKFRNKLV